MQHDKQRAMSVMRRLQREDEQVMDQAVREQQEKDQENMLCQICYDTIYIEDMAVMENCDHVYHKECLRDNLAADVENNNFPLICPICKSEKPKNEHQEISQYTMGTILSREMYQTYLNKVFNLYIDTNKEFKHCTTPNC